LLQTPAAQICIMQQIRALAIVFALADTCAELEERILAVRNM
jgi:hypothetical protein